MHTTPRPAVAAPRSRLCSPSCQLPQLVVGVSVGLWDGCVCDAELGMASYSNTRNAGKKGDGRAHAPCRRFFGPPRRRQSAVRGERLNSPWGLGLATSCQQTGPVCNTHRELLLIRHNLTHLTRNHGPANMRESPMHTRRVATERYSFDTCGAEACPCASVVDVVVASGAVLSARVRR